MIGSLILSYILVGLVFGLAFVARGHKVIDPVAAGASLGLRLLWLPAALALWPLLLVKWVDRGKAG